MADILLPKKEAHTDYPVIFLAGPIRGAPMWQYDAIDCIMSKADNVAIASPRRTIRDDLQQYVSSGFTDFPRQRSWERHYLGEACHKGCVMFWLPGQLYDVPGKAYGKMTTFELAQLSTAYQYDDKVRFVIGTDGNFPEFDTMLVDIKGAKPDIEIYSTLEETCDAALGIALTDPFESNFG